jgi:hypothetical protein
MATYGRYLTADTDTVTIVGSNNNNQRFTVFDPMPENGWGYAFSILAGKTGATSPQGRLAVATVDGNGNPNDRMAYSNTITFSGTMSNGSDGTRYTATLAFVDHPTYGYDSTGVQLYAGLQYAVGFSVTGASLMVGMIAASNPANNYQNKTDYLKDTSSVTPSDPIASTSSGSGNLTVAILYDPNVPPLVGGIGPSGAITTLTPNMSLTFSDFNSTRGDHMNAYQFQVRVQSTQVMMWNYYTLASAAESAANAVNIPYAGTALSGSTVYEIRARVYDRFSADSGWSAWGTFTTPSVGSMTTTSPTGKQLTLTPGPFVGTWTHPSALSMTQWQARILDSQGHVIQTSAINNLALANNAGFSITWATTGFTALSKGLTYTAQFIGKDSNNVWANWGVTNTPLVIDAPPDVPTGITPISGQLYTSIPKMTVLTVDSDNPMPGGGVSASVRIKDSAGNVLATKAAALRAGSSFMYDTAAVTIGTNEVQLITKGGTITGGTFTITVPTNALGAAATTAAINWNDVASVIQTKLEALANVGVGNILVGGGPINSANVTLTFRNQLQGYDLAQITVTNSLTGTAPTITPSTTTNGAANEIPRPGTYYYDANATDGTFASDYMAPIPFSFTNGNIVTITSPTPSQVIATNAPTITWTVVGTQVSATVFIYKTGTSSPIIAGDTIVGAGLSYAVPPGYLKNGVTYDVVVTSVDNNGVGGSQTQTFSVSYTVPTWTGINFTATPTAIGSDSNASAIVLGWTAPAEAPSLIYRITLKRRDTGTLSGDASEITLARITNPNQTTFVDGIPVNNKSYTYSIIKSIYIDATKSDTVDSAEVTADAAVAFSSIVVCSVADPLSYRANLRIQKSNKVDHNDDIAYFQTWGDSEPYAQLSGVDYETISGSYSVVTDRFGSAKAVMDQLRALNARQKSMGDVICYRDDRGRRAFVTMKLSETDTQLGMYEVALTMTEVNYVEGI